MARTRATDYDDKRRAILARAARLFADDGFDRVSMAAIAAGCGVSKALLYHYYESKDALLFDVIGEHLQVLCEAVEEADEPAAEPEARLSRLVRTLLDCYRDADAQHKVQVNDLSKLPPEKQNELKEMERRLVQVFARALLTLNPDLDKNRPLLKPVTMSLFGMLNWHYMWFRPQGPISREDYADIATRIIVSGARTLT